MQDMFTDRWVGQFTDVYDQARLADVPWFTAAPGIKVMEAVVDGTVRRGDRVVDLGCGPGCDAVFLATCGAQVTGVDIARTAIERARRLAEWAAGEVAFVEASALDTGLPTGEADVVNDSFVFHNIRDESRADYAREVHRLLRPGGLFLLSAFSDGMAAGTGPNRISSPEIFAAFTADEFTCLRLEQYSNLPTESRPDQLHWFGVFQTVTRP